MLGSKRLDWVDSKKAASCRVTVKIREYNGANARCDTSKKLDRFPNGTCPKWTSAKQTLAKHNHHSLKHLILIPKLKIVRNLKFES